MCRAGYRKKVVPFVLTLIAGLGAASFESERSSKHDSLLAPVSSQGGRGLSGDGTIGAAISPAADTRNLKILSKPRAVYTNEARRNLTAGAVVLRVTFLASGEIGAVTTVSELPDGLTEQAVAAARAIRFEPAKRDGQNVSVTKTVEYQFTIY